MLLEEDVKLVAQQANVSIDLARNALESTKGDLAQAILLLAQR
jgi:nascent polypeptide-associated complex subunit alpha